MAPQSGPEQPPTPEEILEMPALEAPDGEVNNFDVEPPLNGVVYFTFALSIFIVTFFVASWLVARWNFLRKGSPVDIMNLVGYGFYIACMAWAIMLANRDRFFVDMWNVQVKEISPILFDMFICASVWMVSMGLIKAAILYDWIRILVPHGTRNYMFWSCHILAAFILLFYASILTAFQVGCTPAEEDWSCLLTEYTDIVSTAVNLTWDIITLVLPQKIIWSLQLNRRKKISLSVIFGFGILACVAAAFRMSGAIQFKTSPNATYTMSGYFLWCVAEITCAFIVLCAPTLPKAFQVFGIRSGLDKTHNLSKPSSNSFGGRSNGLSTGKSGVSGGVTTHIGSDSSVPGRPYQRLSDEYIGLTDVGRAS